MIHRYYIHSENPCFFSTNLKISFDAVLLKTIKNEEKTTKIVAYADNFFLPFNLLAAITFLPPAVFILCLNP